MHRRFRHRRPAPKLRSASQHDHPAPADFGQGAAQQIGFRGRKTGLGDLFVGRKAESVRQHVDVGRKSAIEGRGDVWDRGRTQPRPRIRTGEGIQQAAQILGRNQRPLQHDQAQTAQFAVVSAVVLRGRESVVSPLYREASVLDPARRAAQMAEQLDATALLDVIRMVRRQGDADLHASIVVDVAEVTGGAGGLQARRVATTARSVLRSGCSLVGRPAARAAHAAGVRGPGSDGAENSAKSFALVNTSSPVGPSTGSPAGFYGGWMPRSSGCESGLPAAPALLLELIQRLAILADATTVRGERER